MKVMLVMNMMHRVLKVILIVIFFVIAVIASKAQPPLLEDGNYQNPRDTLNFRYHFQAGDTLRYKVESHDSIIINRGKPLVKFRTEKIQIVCDSIRNGHYFLSQKLLSVKAKEIEGSKTVERQESEWIGRKAWFEIDTLGKRYSYGVDDSTRPALTPGGAFQPFIITNLGETHKALKVSWIVEQIDDIPENGIPVPALKQTSLFRADTLLDTLKEKCSRVTFVKTGIGSIKMIQSDNSSMKVNVVINSYGVLDISAEKFIPIHYFMTEEQKLKIKLSDGPEKEGVHFINSYFTLTDYKHKFVKKEAVAQPKKPEPKKSLKLIPKKKAGKR